MQYFCYSPLNKSWKSALQKAHFIKMHSQQRIFHSHHLQLCPICFLHVQVRRKVKTEESPRLRPSDLRNFITMFVVFVLFAICWAPLNLIGLAVAIDPSRVAPRIPEWLFVVSYFMAYFNSCLNAIIYGLLNRNFRNEYKRIVTSVWVTRLFVTETSRAATDGRSMRSKQSPPPPLNNNESVRDRTNKE